MNRNKLFQTLVSKKQQNFAAQAGDHLRSSSFGASEKQNRSRHSGDGGIPLPEPASLSNLGGFV